MTKSTEIVHNKSHINTMFKTMTLVDKVHSNSSALVWLESHHKKFCGFANGQYLDEEWLVQDLQTSFESYDVLDYFSSKALCQVYTSSGKNLLEWTAQDSAEGFNAWSDVSARTKSKILNDIAKNIETHHELLSVVEALSSGKHLYKAKKEITDLIKSFKYYASCVLKFEDKPMSDAWHSIGPVCVVSDEYSNPSITLNFRISSLLASGNSVLLLTHAHCSLSAFLLAEICSKSGLPNGVLNVIPMNPESFKNPVEIPVLSKLIFTGSLERSMLYSTLNAEAQMHCDVLIPRRPVVIVYENADLHSAANSVLESLFYHDTRSTSGGCKVLVQENIYNNFQKVLLEKFHKCKFGSNLTQTDFSAIVTEEQESVLTEQIEKSRKCKAQMTEKSDGKVEYRTINPTLFSSIPTNSKLVQEELGGPIIVSVPFRTVKESISMFNCENKGSPVSIWTEVLRIALEVSQKLKSGVIWVNSENVFDPRFPFSGVYLSGNSLEDGKDAIFNNMSVLNERFNINQDNGLVFHKVDGNETSLNKNIKTSHGSDSGVLTAVSKASSSQPNWDALTDPGRRKILSSIMEKLNKNRKDHVVELQKVNGLSSEDCEKEFESALDVLYYWAMQNDKYTEPIKEITSDLMVVQKRDSLGVIGIQCPEENHLLSFISLVIPAIMNGNSVITISSMKYKAFFSSLTEAFTAANLPGGVINIVFGDPPILVQSLRRNTDVNAVWYTDVPPESIFSYNYPLQRLFYCNGIWNDLTEAKCLKFTLESTYSKSVFMPYGDIFAN